MNLYFADAVRAALSKNGSALIVLEYDLKTPASEQERRNDSLFAADDPWWQGELLRTRRYAIVERDPAIAGQLASGRWVGHDLRWKVYVKHHSLQDNRMQRWAYVLREETDVLALLARPEFKAPDPLGPVWKPVEWGQYMYFWIPPMDHRAFFSMHIEYGANLVGMQSQ